jgi:hypothetical protein
MDDCFQEKAVPGMDTNEFLQIIKTCSCWACPLNMAQVDLKGKFFFNSPLIMGTTNARGIQSTTAGEVIHDVEAVARRINYAIDIKVKEEWSVTNDVGARVLDYGKLEEHIDQKITEVVLKAESGAEISQMDVIDVFPWHAWEVNKINPLTGHVIDSGLELKEVVFSCARSLRERLTTHERAVKGLNTFNRLLANAKPVDLGTNTVEKQGAADRYANITSSVSEIETDDQPNLGVEESGVNLASPVEPMLGKVEVKPKPKPKQSKSMDDYARLRHEYCKKVGDSIPTMLIRMAGSCVVSWSSNLMQTVNP